MRSDDINLALQIIANFKKNQHMKNVIMITLSACILISCTTWKPGNIYITNDKSTTYKIDTLNGSTGIYKIGTDNKSKAKTSHFYKITAYHDAWVELDTTGTNIQFVTATKLKSKLVFLQKYNSSTCNTCKFIDTAFEYKEK